MTTEIPHVPSKFDIVDAHGNYHDVSRNAFDALSVDSPMKALVEQGGPWLKENFKETFARVSKATGVSLKDLSSSGMRKAARRVAGSVAGHLVGKASALGASALNPLVGLAVSELCSKRNCRGGRPCRTSRASGWR